MPNSATRPGRLSESLEDYLEAILHITEEKRAARAKDIGARIGVTGASVTGALRALARRGLVNYAPYDIVTLTPKGHRIARGVAHRHDVLKEFFVNVMSVGAGDAETYACRMEHALPDRILKRFVELAGSYENGHVKGARKP